MKFFKLLDYDVFFLGYDEPNFEENLKRIKSVIPWVKHVFGIKGSDTAHKTCAMLCNTDRIIIIDGDNYITDDFLNQVIELKEGVDDSHVVFSWPSKNSVNGLIYGNGGIKCWPTQLIKTMNTHENSSSPLRRTKIDFCWDIDYLTVGKSYSTTFINTTSQQAFRSGFREGVKMSLHNGDKVSSFTEIPKGNFKRLLSWLTIGSDVENGLWAICGAWDGLYRTYCTDWDYTEINNHETINDYFLKNFSLLSNQELMNHITMCRDELLNLDNSLNVSLPLDKEESKLYKENTIVEITASDLVKSKPLYTGYDIVMITYDEPECEENYIKLLKRFPTAKRVHGVKGIHNAHIEAAKLVSTDMFWVVDGDAIIEKNFSFSFKLNAPDDTVRVWRSKNPINDLTYGYGGVKLLPREKTLNMDITNTDMTTSISNKFIPIGITSNITKFNTSEFHTWRSAFRECCKLSSKVISRQKNDETDKRLDSWCTLGIDREFGKYSIDGAMAGKEYGLRNKGNVEALKKINDFKWLKEQFDEFYK